jgi:hypothetical protein
VVKPSGLSGGKKLILKNSMAPVIVATKKRRSKVLIQSLGADRHCEEPSDEAISTQFARQFRWVAPSELPEHLRVFTEEQANKRGMRFPAFGIIDDDAPQAFAYGHHPSNARTLYGAVMKEEIQLRPSPM